MSEERDTLKVYLNKDLKAKVKNRAKQEGVSLSTFVILAIKKYCNFPEVENRETENQEI